MKESGEIKGLQQKTKKILRKMEKKYTESPLEIPN
jgi:hypothetical protein